MIYTYSKSMSRNVQNPNGARQSFYKDVDMHFEKKKEEAHEENKLLDS